MDKLVFTFGEGLIEIRKPKVGLCRAWDFDAL